MSIFPHAQLHTLVVDKLIRSQIVDSMSVVNWLFLPATVSQFYKYVYYTTENIVSFPDLPAY